MQRFLFAFLALIAARTSTAQAPVQYLAEEARLDARRIRGITPVPVERLLVLHGDTMLAIGRDASIPMMFDMKASINAWNGTIRPNMKSQFYGVGNMGTVGDHPWGEDRYNREVVQWDHAGKVVKSATLPTWVHPHWAERHKYPLIGSMEVFGLYSDGKMLVRAGKPRTLFDTPGYKRSFTHLLLIEPGGGVEKEIAQFDPWSHRVELYSQGKPTPFTILAPWAMGDRWRISDDGTRIAVAHAGPLASDSGKTRVTLLNQLGDTLFSKWYSLASMPVSKASLDSALAKYDSYAGFTAAQVRDSVRIRIPAYRALLSSVLNSANATWLFTRSPVDSVKDLTAFVLDDQGTMAAKVFVPEMFAPLAVDRTHLWASDKRDKSVVRFVLQATPPATPVQQPRSGLTAADKKPASQ